MVKHNSWLRNDSYSPMLHIVQCSYYDTSLIFEPFLQAMQPAATKSGHVAPNNSLIIVVSYFYAGHFGATMQNMFPPPKRRCFQVIVFSRCQQRLHTRDGLWFACQIVAPKLLGFYFHMPVFHTNWYQEYIGKQLSL